MIQRIQTIYLALSLISLLLISVGVTVFKVTTSVEHQFEMTSYATVYGIQQDLKVTGEISPENKVALPELLASTSLSEVKNVPTRSLPLYIVTLLASLLALFALLSYKKLALQYTLSKWLFIVTLLVFIASGVLFYLYKSSTVGTFEGGSYSTTLSTGFYCIATAVAFAYLALHGVKKDIELIKSIDRIR